MVVVGVGVYILMLAACYIMVTAIRPHAMSLAGLASEKASFFLTKFVSVDHILRYSQGSHE